MLIRLSSLTPCLFAAALLVVTAQGSGTAFPLSGGYGFDWLQPRTSRCRLVSPAEVPAMGACTFRADGRAFGLALPHHVCTLSSRNQYLVYATQQQCLEAFDTMQTHAE
ncbi:MAG: hypothetical protein ACKO5M_05800 [Vulcanococcus sp.]